MEALIEILVEFLGEILIELLAALFAHFSSYVSSNTKAKRIIKYCVAAIIFSATLVLLIMSICYKKTLYIGLVIGYFLILLIIYIIKFLNRNIWKNPKAEQAILWTNRGIHYVFPIILIIFSAIHQNKATPAIIILSCVALGIYLGINLYRLETRNKRSSYIDFVKKFRKKSEAYRKNSKKKKSFLNFLYMNKDSFFLYIQKEIQIEDLKLLKKLIPDLSSRYNSKLFLELLTESQKKLECDILDFEISEAYEKLKLPNF